MLEIVRYPVESPLLRQLVCFFWHMTSEYPVELRHKLLPVANTDVIVNLSGPVTYQLPRPSVAAGGTAHICGVKSRSQFLRQQGSLEVWGICFYPHGLRPFLGNTVPEVADQVADLRDLSPGFSHQLVERLLEAKSPGECLAVLEAVLLACVDPALLAIPDIRLLEDYRLRGAAMGVEDWCRGAGVSRRQLERVAMRHTGLTPKLLQRVCRFQAVSNRLMHRPPGSLADLALEAGYADQAHFNRDFKQFAGATPTRFLEERLAIKQVSHITGL